MGDNRKNVGKQVGEKTEKEKKKGKLREGYENRASKDETHFHGRQSGSSGTISEF